MKLRIREIAVFAMLGSMMFVSKLLMEALPNIHLLGVMIMAITLVYRWKALYPIYVYVMLDGLYLGFKPTWLPYLYIWTLLWGATMLLPRSMPKRLSPIVYMTVCGAHGLLFGLLYAPVQAWIVGMDLSGMLAWVAVGFPYDCVHAVSNFVLGGAILPIATVIRKTDRR